MYVLGGRFVTMPTAQDFQRLGPRPPHKVHVLSTDLHATYVVDADDLVWTKLFFDEHFAVMARRAPGVSDYEWEMRLKAVKAGVDSHLHNREVPCPIQVLRWVEGEEPLPTPSGQIMQRLPDGTYPDRAPNGEFHWLAVLDLPGRFPSIPERVRPSARRRQERLQQRLATITAVAEQQMVERLAAEAAMQASLAERGGLPAPDPFTRCGANGRRRIRRPRVQSPRRRP